MLGIENCERKNKYQSVHEAKEQINRVHKRQKNIRLRVYKCHHCHSYHLTSSERFVSIQANQGIKDFHKLKPYNRAKSYKTEIDLDD